MEQRGRNLGSLALSMITAKHFLTFQKFRKISQNRFALISEKVRDTDRLKRTNFWYHMHCQ